MIPQKPRLTEIWDAILSDGHSRQDTTELLGVSFEITDRLFTDLWHRPKSEPAIGLLEGLMLVAGESWPQLLLDLAPGFKIAQDGQIFHGAYGPRLRNSTEMMYRQLRRTPLSRRAYAPIYRRDDLSDRSWPADTPCTTGLQFLVRNGQLEMFTTMRSNDAWLGLCYDAIMFRVLHSAMAYSLELGRGRHHHYTASLHIYDRDSLSVRKAMLEEPKSEIMSLEFPWYQMVPRWGNLRKTASRALTLYSCSGLVDRRIQFLRTAPAWSRLDAAWDRIKENRK